MQPQRRGVTLCARLRVKFARSIPSSVILSGANIDRYLHSRDPQDRPKVGIYERFSITLSNHFARSKLQSNLPFGFHFAQDDARQSDPKHSYRILPHPPSSGAPSRREPQLKPPSPREVARRSRDGGSPLLSSHDALFTQASAQLRLHRRGVTVFARLCVKLARGVPLSVILSGGGSLARHRSRNPQDRPKVGIYVGLSITPAKPFREIQIAKQFALRVSLRSR